MRLSAAMIVRDEEHHLPDCLRSVGDLVDEIVVVDTGSRDETPAIARRFGARVVEIAWPGDFATARNVALEQARGEWILYVDADERVRPADRAQVAKLLDDRSVVAYTVLFRPQTGYTRYREFRIFRNDPRIRFRSMIHETMLPALEEVSARDGLRIAPCDVAIDHIGYDGDQSHKHARNLPLLRARLAADPDHVYCWTHLGRTLQALGRGEEAREAWRRGIAVVRGRPALRSLDSLPFLDLLRHLPESDPEFPTLLEETLAMFPHDHSLRWIEGRVLMSAGRFAEAIARFESLAAIDPESFCDAFIAYDMRIFGVQTYDSLGLCHFRLGDYAASARWYARAAAAAPGDPSYRLKQQFMESRSRGGGS
jgi:tetratricopeptide (TPR) repeat protein